MLILRGLPLLLLSLGCFATAAESNADIEAHIRHVQDSLVPAVLVKGEREKTTRLADRMAELHVPGVSVAVIHDGKLEWARGFGVIQLGGPAVTPETLFQAASISKPVSAIAVLRLVESGRLDLDTDVNLYLASWKIPANSFTNEKAVTLRQLLTHTAGMSVHGFPGYASGAPLPNLKQILDGEAPANSAPIRVDAVPSTQWSYSGGGYVVIQQLLDDVTGEPFPQLMRRSVLGPMGMTHSTYEQPLPATAFAVATPYDADGNPIKGGPHTYPEMAPAGLWTTPSDLANYAMTVQQALSGKPNSLLSPQMTRQMLTEVRNNWGLGPELGGSAAHRYFQHGGSNEGYKCGLFVFEKGDGVVIMTNGDNGWELVREIRRTVARDYGWPDFQPAEHVLANVSAGQFDRLAGTYRLSPTWTVSFTREGNRFFAQAVDGAREEIFPESGHAFFVKETERQFFFDADDQGRATQVTIKQARAEDTTSKRLDDAASQRIEARLAARNKRVLAQMAAPGSEAALRRDLEELRQGTPDYTHMGDDLAQLVRENLDGIKRELVPLGAISTVSFERVTPEGTDVYKVGFADGECRVWIFVAPDKKTHYLEFRRL
jgi:CubicO group peptidase (beta-lactamase class C family)